MSHYRVCSFIIGTDVLYNTFQMMNAAITESVPYGAHAVSFQDLSKIYLAENHVSFVRSSLF